MKKSELVELVASKAGLTKADANRAIDALLETVKEELVKGNKVPLAGFGTFQTSERSARDGRNPQTGETLHIAARTVPTFKAASALKEAVNK